MIIITIIILTIIIIHVIDKSSFIKHQSDFLRKGMIRVYYHLLVPMLRYGCGAIENILKQLGSCIN